ncbi:transporter [Ramlibacter sp.]|uniref:transporter n=1 Tax=Ramlibacter sp. TaxID=1917967 RepID=UPI002C73ECEC|nr:transporter [Ramlibacter sp.]HWI81697.1 transporter [Ramlibacter sp.]
MSLHASRLVPALACALAALVSPPARASCGSAYCSLNTDLAAEATGVAEGGLFDLRYERIRQDQPRSGGRRVQVGEIARHHDEVRTTNQNLIASYSRTFASGWGFSVTEPLVDRDHLHIHNHRGAQQPQAWHFTEPGDLRVTGRYQATLPAATDGGARTVGAIFGLKLPTGRTNIANGAGDVAERSLQPGTGTTDAIVGAFVHQQLPRQDASWFAQAQYQRPLGSRAGYRPGAQFSADVGYAKALADRLSGIVQVNAVFKGRDRGAEAEPADSGSRAFFVSPGASYQLSALVRAYAFVQQPLHQHVNGVQLTARRAVVLGVATRF